MKCETVKIGETTAIICGRGRRTKRCGCGKPAPLLCDWKIGNGKTCDKPICRGCAQHVADDKDLCPEHQVAYAEWRAKRQGQEKR